MGGLLVCNDDRFCLDRYTMRKSTRIADTSVGNRAPIWAVSQDRRVRFGARPRSDISPGRRDAALSSTLREESDAYERSFHESAPIWSFAGELRPELHLALGPHK